MSMQEHSVMATMRAYYRGGIRERDIIIKDHAKLFDAETPLYKIYEWAASFNCYARDSVVLRREDNRH